MNSSGFVLSGNLYLRVCGSSALNASGLAVTVTVTENPDWSIAYPETSIQTFINDQFVGIPGTMIRPLPAEIWYPDGNCLDATVENAFINTSQLSGIAICPFHAVVAVADYSGRLHSSDTLICQPTMP